MSKRKLDILNTLKDQGVKLTPMELIALENQIDLQDTMMDITNSIKVAKGDKGDDGKDADPKEVAKEIKKDKELIESIRGKEGKKGDKGDPGKDGTNGITPIKGKDYFTDADITDIAMSVESQLAPIVMEVGSSIEELGIKIEENIKTPEDIRDMLESLQDESRLDAKAIKNLPQTISKIEKQVTGMRGIKDVYDSTGVKSTSSLGIKFTGTGVGSVTEYDGVTTIDIIGGVTPANDQVKTSIADTTRGYLNEKLTVSSPLTKTIVSPGANETLNLAMPVATSSVDGYLDNADWTTFNNKENVLSFTSPLSRTGNTVTTSMATNKLIGRGTAGTGVFEEITLGTGLSFAGTTLNATGTIDGSGTTNELTYWVDSNTIGALPVATYPSLTELSYGKGVTSAIQTQIDGKLSDSGDTGTGAYDFGGATTFEIPNSAAPTLNATGQIAVDTTVTDFTNGLLKYYSTAEYGVVAMPIASFTSPTNGYVVAYNSTNDAFELVAQSGGGGGITIGTTTITSGTDTRILFQDGTVVGEDSTLRWNKTLDYLYVNNTTLSTPGVVNNLYLGTYPTAIVAGGGGANTAVGSGAAATVTSGSGITAVGTNACSTATAALFAVGIGYQAFLNATPTRGFAGGGSSQSNNAGTDSFSLGNLSMINATSEIGSIMIGTNSGTGCTTGFWNIGIGDGTVYATGGAAYGNTVVGKGAGQTVGGSFAANRNTLIGYQSDATAGLTGVIALGAGATALTSNTIVIGGTITAPTRVYFGLGESSATATAIILSATNGVGTDKAGGDLILAGGQNTNAGTPGYVYVSTAATTTTGSVLQSLVNRARYTSTYFESLTTSSFAMPFAAGSASAPTYSFLGDTNTGIYSDSADTLQFSTAGTLRMSINTAAVIHARRNEQAKGADVAAANDLTLGKDGNGFVITGNTQINAITKADWQAGSIISLVFTGTPTVKHNTAGGAGTAVLFLNGSVDLTAANNTTLTLMYDGTQWQELARKVA